MAGPDCPHEGRQVRRHLLRHGADHDPRQALQQRSAAGADSRHECLHPFRRQAQPRPRQRHRRRQCRRLADGLPVRRQPRPRLSALQSGRVHHIRHARPRRGRLRNDDRLRSDGQLLRAGPQAPGLDSANRPRRQGNAHHAGRHRGLHGSDLRHQHRRHRLPHGRRPHPPAARVPLAAPQRLRRPHRHRRARQSEIGNQRSASRAVPAPAPVRSPAPPMPDLLKISGGTVYDPANGIDGEVRDLWIAGGKIVAAPADPDAAARRAQSTPAAWSSCPAASTCTATSPGPRSTWPAKCGPKKSARPKCCTAPPRRTAARWAASPARSPRATSTPAWATPRPSTPRFRRLAARHAHEEFADTPCIDKGFTSSWATTTMSCNPFSDHEPQKLKAFIGWLLGAAKGYAPKLVNPGGVEVWKSHQGGNVHGLDQPVDHFDVTPRQIIGGVARAAARTAPAASRAHPLQQPRHARQLEHDAGNDEGPRRPSRPHHAHPVSQLRRRRRGREHVQQQVRAAWPSTSTRNRNVTVDVGQVLFGETTSMTGDGPLGYFLSQGLRRQVVLERHRNGGRLRHHADQVQEQIARPLAAMGDRTGVVPAGRTTPGAW